MNNPNPPKPDVPAEIRAELARRGWTVPHLAKQTNLNYVTLYRRLNGDGPLRLPELIAICDAFGIRVSSLIARAEDVAA